MIFKIVFNSSQFQYIRQYVRNHPGLKVEEFYLFRQQATGLFQQTSADLEILIRLGFGRTPEYGFCCDILHSCTEYKKVRLPEMNPSHKSQMEILSSFSSRIVELNLLPSVDVEMKNLDYSVNIEKETCNLDVTLVS